MIYQKKSVGTFQKGMAQPSMEPFQVGIVSNDSYQHWSVKKRDVSWSAYSLHMNIVSSRSNEAICVQ
jgi:hypothetical protein